VLNDLKFNRMHWGHINLRLRGCLLASNIFDSTTSKYRTINIICRTAQSVEQKTDIQEAQGLIPRYSTFFSSRMLFIYCFWSSYWKRNECKYSGSVCGVWSSVHSVWTVKCGFVWL
jgi:hypothetical protein